MQSGQGGISKRKERNDTFWKPARFPATSIDGVSPDECPLHEPPFVALHLGRAAVSHFAAFEKRLGMDTGCLPESELKIGNETICGKYENGKKASF